jgi:anti-anti-sigma factor
MDMFDIQLGENKEIRLIGKFDASQADKATSFFGQIQDTHTVNFEKLDYISSMGLSILLVTQKRLLDTGHELVMIKMTGHIRDVFGYAGFDEIFKIIQS